MRADNLTQRFSISEGNNEGFRRKDVEEALVRGPTKIVP